MADVNVALLVSQTVTEAPEPEPDQDGQGLRQLL